MTYVPSQYWTERGKGYEAEAIDKGWVSVENQPLFDLLETLEFSSVLELGCGFGRVGYSILKHYPDVAYTGIDVSPDMIESARRRIPQGELICADLAEWDSDRTWDLVVAVSVLGHILPADIASVIGKMRKWATKDIIAIDWDAPGQSTTFQYGHSYGSLYGSALKALIPYGRQSVFHVRP
jgi:trans-aconitate methyltransferase